MAIRWPTRWTLPFGFTIQVRRVTPALMKRVAKYPYRGYWPGFTNQTGTIYINTDTPLDDQLDTLSHEMRHALTDWDAVVQDMRAKVMEERLREKLEADHDASVERS